MIGITINMIAFELFIFMCCYVIGFGLSGNKHEAIHVSVITDVIIHILGFAVILLATFGDTVII